MSKSFPSDFIHVEGLRLWAHVGVLEHERLLGQYFELNFSLMIDLGEASRNDDMEKTVDYSIAIKQIQKLAFSVECLTLERFSEEILDCLEDLYGHVPMKIVLKKCSAPVSGFSGKVAVERNRYSYKE